MAESVSCSTSTAGPSSSSSCLRCVHVYMCLWCVHVSSVCTCVLAWTCVRVHVHVHIQCVYLSMYVYVVMSRCAYRGQKTHLWSQVSACLYIAFRAITQGINLCSKCLFPFESSHQGQIIYEFGGVFFGLFVLESGSPKYFPLSAKFSCWLILRKALCWSIWRQSGFFMPLTRVCVNKWVCSSSDPRFWSLLL